ncbi:precorrin-3B synthase [Streptomyces pactum]|uniref:precorrin-3B synthase n=1 Tax=Streptomyces pactum TaxID=68249 RepID=UPI0036F65D77
MSLTPTTGPTGAQPPPRGRGDACPGALRLHAADDGSLARVRLPAGLLTSRQALALARASEELGDGLLDITSRGNVQLRGLSGGCGGELADRLRTAGLLPSDRHERARNIVASPLAGLDGAGHGEVAGWVRSLDALLCAEADTAGLSGRFLFALDDGRGDVAALGADVTLIAGAGGEAVLRVGPAGSARPPAQVLVAAGDAPRAAVLAASYFLDLVRESGGRAWRVAELPADHAVTAARLVARLAAAGVPARPAAKLPPGTAGGVPAAAAGQPWEVAPGVVDGPDGRCALSVLAPLGRLTAAQWRLLAGTAARDGADELRVTPWRGVVLPGLERHTARDRLAGLAAAGLVVDRGSPWSGVGACAGRTGCAKSLRDVRADAADAVRRTGPGALPVYWSGCERRCGRPATGRWVDVLATRDGYRVSVHGTAQAGGTAPAVPAEEAAGAVAAARGTT